MIWKRYIFLGTECLSSDSLDKVAFGLKNDDEEKN